MQQTTNYNLNLPEGTDVVNPLVDYNPNFSTIDSAMKANADRTVGRASCIKSGTTHVVTRSNTGSNIINFTATGDWNTGDTMTIDGTSVSVFLQDGTAPLTGAYVINTEVIAVISGSRVTLYGAQKLPGYTASDISYDNTGSGLNASDVQDAIDEVVTKFDRGNVSVTADGVKTAAELFAELFNAADISNVTPNAALSIGKSKYAIAYMDSQQLRFGGVATGNGTSIDLGAARLTGAVSGCHYVSATVTSTADFHNYDTTPLTIGTVITLYY